MIAAITSFLATLAGVLFFWRKKPKPVLELDEPTIPDIREMSADAEQKIEELIEERESAEENPTMVLTAKELESVRERIKAVDEKLKRRR